MPHYILGIDGGGTSCRAAVAGADGRILGRGKSGAANILTDPDNALIHIVSAATAAFEEAGIAPSEIGSACALVGVAGSNVGDAVHYVKERLPFAKADIESDGLIALQGALGDSDGAVAILGTGSIYISRQGDEVRYIGGWGFQIGDLGSGARLGHALLQESVLAFDRIHPSSPLTDAVMAEFNNDPREAVEFARAAVPGEFGRFAPKIFDYAARNDPVAIALLKGCAQTVDEALDALVAQGSRKLCLLGGLAPIYRPWLAERHQPLFIEPEADALTGSVALAAKRFVTGSAT
ncbi:N-acetylglucosamine kinase [Rhizobium sp. LjRoot98]|uniref:N-acetylglucosamine kinase n=1 Tax=unclassified Rhizobium TaxID=2613769 RepID=UPI0007160B94|nr:MULTISPECIES: N-acetylglucosamine kinase [unclassified Rhizobium]KQV39282.1 N-acetylglucosamine kinase [Rhizobium sp. Root1204]KQY18351.1 N-acetylglucosamine kinase [Rhizobium sp. Root1334]KRB98649.1 N-acetylglucosamine kinase [Rhizobium sp. Root73]